MIKCPLPLVIGVMSVLALGPAQAQTPRGGLIDNGADRQRAPAALTRDALSPRARASRQTLQQAVGRDALADDRLRQLRLRRALRARAIRANGAAGTGGTDNSLARSIGGSPGAADGRSAIGGGAGADGLRNFRGRGLPSNGNTSLRLRPRISR